jgi:hypothetical protein
MRRAKKNKISENLVGWLNFYDQTKRYLYKKKEEKDTYMFFVFIIVRRDDFVLHIILDNVVEVHVHVLLVVQHLL